MIELDRLALPNTFGHHLNLKPLSLKTISASNPNIILRVLETSLTERFTRGLSDLVPAVSSIELSGCRLVLRFLSGI